MSFWNMLEIDPTEDIRVIKKAYAQNLKIHHPEEDPEGYQKLREAYDLALAYVKEEKVSTVQATSGNSAANSFVFASDLSLLDETKDEISELDAFIDRLRELYADFPTRINLSKWEAALNNEVVWKAEYQDILRAKTLDFLMDHPYLPKNVWLLLDSIFNWRAQEDYFFDHFPGDFVHFLLKQLNHPLDLSFRFLQEAKDVDYDAFLSNRENAFYALADGNLELAGNFISAAKTIFTEDPDLLRLQGEYHFRSGDWQQALQSYDHALELAPDDLECLLNRARTLREMGRLSHAIEACAFIKAILPENLDALFLQGKCYFEMGDKEKAKETFLEALAINPFDIEGKIYLAKINGLLLDELKGYSSKEKVQKRKQIKKELGLPGFLQTMRSFLLLAIRRTWVPLLIVGFVLAISLMGNPPEENTVKPVIIHSTKDLYQVPPEANRVKLSLTTAYFLSSLDENKIQVDQKPDLQNRYFVIAQMDGQFIVLNVDYEQAQQVYEQNQLDFEGQIYDMDPHTLNFIKSSLMQQLNNTDDRFGDSVYASLLKDKYVGPIEASETEPRLYMIFKVIVRMVFIIPISFYIIRQARKKILAKRLQSN